MQPFYRRPPPKTVRIWLTSNSDCLRQRASQSAPAGMCPIKDVREILLRKISLLSDLSRKFGVALYLPNKYYTLAFLINVKYMYIFF